MASANVPIGLAVVAGFAAPIFAALTTGNNVAVAATKLYKFWDLPVSSIVVLLVVCDVIGTLLYSQGVMDSMGALLLATRPAGTPCPGSTIIAPAAVGGMLTALIFITAITLKLRVPISATQIMLVSLVTAQVFIGGWASISPIDIIMPVITWILVPLITGFFTYFTFQFLSKSQLKMAPILAGITVCVVAFDPIRRSTLLFGAWIIVIPVAAVAVGVVAVYVAVKYVFVEQTETLIEESMENDVEPEVVSLQHETTLSVGDDSMTIGSAPDHAVPQNTLNELETVSETGSVAGSTVGLTQNLADIELDPITEGQQGSETMSVSDVHVEHVVQDVEVPVSNNGDTMKYNVMTIISIVLLSVGHGANDAPNSLVPISSVMYAVMDVSCGMSVFTPPFWAVLLVALGVLCGGAFIAWPLARRWSTDTTDVSQPVITVAVISSAAAIGLSVAGGLPASTTQIFVAAWYGAMKAASQPIKPSKQWMAVTVAGVVLCLGCSIGLVLLVKLTL